MRINNAQLTFEDLWLLAKHSNFVNFQYQPQDSIVIQNSLVVGELDTLQIYLGFDHTVTANTYEWYKDGNFISTSTTNRLKIFPAKVSDAGEYFCKIKNSGNPAWGTLELTTIKCEVEVIPCMNADNIPYTEIDSDCIKGVTIELDEAKIINGPIPCTYTYKLYNKVSNDTLYYSSKLLENIKPGFYDLIVADQDQCIKTLKNFINFDEQPKCDVIITPDGDGKNDNYFIDKSCKAKIYDVNGILVRSMSGPEYWNGRDDKGERVPMGVYAIIIEEKISQISL